MNSTHSVKSVTCAEWRAERLRRVLATEQDPMGGTLSSLDFTALGRRDDWEDSPNGYPQVPRFSWPNRHDEYRATIPYDSLASVDSKRSQ